VAATQTRRIIVSVDAPGAKAALENISKSMGGLNKNTKSLANNMSSLTSVFRGWLGFLGIRELTRMSDTFQNLSNRLKILTGDIQSAQSALAGLQGISQRTYQPIEAVAATFTRFSNALKASGATTKEVLDLTETLTNSFRIAGASTGETSNGILQLSQAFSKGKLDGDEFRSVMENNVVLATALKKEYGKDLFQKAKEGAIQITDVLRILAREQESINKAAKELTPTFENSLTKAMTAVTVAVGKLNQSLGVSNGLAYALDKVAIGFSYWGDVADSAIRKIRLKTISSEIDRLAASINTANEANLGKIFDNDFNVVTLEDGRKQLEGLLKQRAELVKLGDKGLQVKDDGNLKSLADKQEKVADKAKSLKKELSELNKAYLKNRITLEQYNEALFEFEIEKVNRKFSEGSTDIFKYRKELQDLRIQELERQFNAGSLAVEEFNSQLRFSSITLLNEQLKAGKITLEEYNKEMQELEYRVRSDSPLAKGTISFIKSVGTVAEGVAKVTENAFGHLADTITNFTETGKFEFADFARTVIREINAMIIRAAIVAPIAKGILGAFDVGSVVGGLGGLSGGSPGTEQLSPFAMGGVMSSRGPIPLEKYASGGIASGPQMALFGEGRQPEAYVPLPDGRNIPVKMEGSGGGGVSVAQTINIYADGSSSGGDKAEGQKGKALADTMRQVALETILKERRPGGILSA
jgi:tape measure domain-containing protein